jgi:hypothetical protein
MSSVLKHYYLVQKKAVRTLGVGRILKRGRAGSDNETITYAFPGREDKKCLRARNSIGRCVGWD